MSRWVLVGAVGAAVGVVLLGGIGRAAEPLTAAEQARYAELDARAIQTFTNVDLAEYVALRRRHLAAKDQTPDPGEEIAHYALKSLGQPFRLNARRFDLSESDCVVFVERCIAMALAWDWGSYYGLCQRLRHKDGKVDFLERNFFTLADWVPNNAWLLEDITDKLGVPTQEFEDVVRRKAFLAKLSFGEDDTEAGRAKAAAKAAKIAATPDEERRLVRYIARDAIVPALPQLRTGDVVLLISKCEAPGMKPWYDCRHMGLVWVPPGGFVQFIAAFRGGVTRIRLTRYLDGEPSVAGLVILRVRPDARERARDALKLVSPDGVVEPQQLDRVVDLESSAAR